MTSNWINERDYILALKERLDYYNDIFIEYIDANYPNRKAIDDYLTMIEESYYNDRLRLSQQYGMEINYIHSNE